MVIASAFIVNPSATLQYLISINYADEYLMLLMELIVYLDSALANRIVAMSLAVLFTLPVNMLPQSYQNEMATIFSHSLLCLNDAMKAKEDLKKRDTISYDDLMDKLEGDAYKDNDWGFGEDVDVVDQNQYENDELNYLQDLMNPLREVDEDVVNEITEINEIAYIQQAFNVI